MLTSSGLVEILGLADRELVALVGGGGKSTLLVELAKELRGRAARVVVTTTTAMFQDQLAQAGPVFWARHWRKLAHTTEHGSTPPGVIALAHSPTPEGKVIGLPRGWVARLWAEGRADYVLVEADGSRGLSLKAFGALEPQVPDTVTTLVLLAGLDILGSPLQEQHVHRADVAAEALGVELGSLVTPELLGLVLVWQLNLLRERFPRARLLAFLNKADSPEKADVGEAIAGELLRQVPTLDGAVVASLAGEGRLRKLGGRVPAKGGRKGVQGHRPAAVPSASAVVLAAGAARRMGGRQKLLLAWQGRPLVEWVVDAALGSQVEETVVVIDDLQGGVAHALRSRPVTLVANPERDRGMSSSLRAGLETILAGREAAGQPEREARWAIGAGGLQPDAVVFLMGDQPFVRSAIVDRLIAAFVESGKAIVRPMVNGRPTHPVLMSAALYDELLRQEGDVGGRQVIARHPEEICLVPVDDARLALDVDTWEDVEELLSNKHSG